MIVACVCGCSLLSCCPSQWSIGIAEGQVPPDPISPRSRSGDKQHAGNESPSSPSTFSSQPPQPPRSATTSSITASCFFMRVVEISDTVVEVHFASHVDVPLPSEFQLRLLTGKTLVKKFCITPRTRLVRFKVSLSLSPLLLHLFNSV